MIADVSRSHVIALIADAAYLPGAYVAAQSILLCGLPEDICVVILHPPDCPSDAIRAWTKATHPRINLAAVDAREFLPPELSSWDSVLAPLFLRFALAEVFPKARKVFYVDSDILAVAGIEDIFRLDLNGRLVAAANDDLVSEMASVKPSWIAYRNALGVPLGTPYLNCGVLLIDAVAWRANGMKQKLVTTYLGNRERCRYFDQSAINLLLKGDYARLSPAWNFQQTYQAIGAEDIVGPRLVHFAGSAKPWRNDGFVFRHDYRDRYREILSGTPFEPYFRPYWRMSRKQIKEAWRSLKRALRGQEMQSGIRRSQIPMLRAKLTQKLGASGFIDGKIQNGYSRGEHV
jgi:lipopolysaccharide biosynthesis glycosyltransferase